jgi:hypothetical protein
MRQHYFYFQLLFASEFHRSSWVTNVSTEKSFSASCRKGQVHHGESILWRTDSTVLPGITRQRFRVVPYRSRFTDHRSRISLLSLRRRGARVRSRAWPWCYPGRSTGCWSTRWRPGRCPRRSRGCRGCYSWRRSWRRTLGSRSENRTKAAYCGSAICPSKGNVIEILVGAAFLERPSLTAICGTYGCAKLSDSCSIVGVGERDC